MHFCHTPSIFGHMRVIIDAVRAWPERDPAFLVRQLPDRRVQRSPGTLSSGRLSWSV
ncbi:MAG TPA: hypothetical protein VHM25_20325 [Polyangiaceae bacterium]|nr:hypothetical protein [Polyangiaceae bacterium]